jgi:hypothetical protein
MSYDIVYKRQFLRTSKGKIIPLVLMGCNNCTETHTTGKERRARDWSAIYFNGENQMVDKTENEIMERLAKLIGGEYQQHFKIYGKWIDDKGLISFFKNGIKTAKTLEELSEQYFNCNYLRSYVSIWGKEFSQRTENHMTVRNSEQLEKFLEIAQKQINNRKDYESVYVCIEYPLEDFEPKVEKEKKIKERLTDYYVVTISNMGYLIQTTSRRIRYSDNYKLAKQFKSQSIADRYVNKLKERNFRYDFGVKHISAQ